jgi:hypothetical protein
LRQGQRRTHAAEATLYDAAYDAEATWQDANKSTQALATSEAHEQTTTIRDSVAGRSNIFCARIGRLQQRVSMLLIEERTITLKAAKDIELRPGLVLPPGLYSGTEERIRADSIGGPNWAVKYRITFTAEQLDSIGANLHPDLRPANVEVTAFVLCANVPVRSAGEPFSGSFVFIGALPCA